jgi:hypothetical protein
MFPSESVANWSLSHARSNVNGIFSSQVIPANDSKYLSGKRPEIQHPNKPSERLFIQQYQNSDVKKVNWWLAGLHLGMQVFASLPNILAPPPHSL